MLVIYSRALYGWRLIVKLMDLIKLHQASRKFRRYHSKDPPLFSFFKAVFESSNLFFMGKLVRQWEDLAELRFYIRKILFDNNILNRWENSRFGNRSALFTPETWFIFLVSPCGFANHACFFFCFICLPHLNAKPARKFSSLPNQTEDIVTCHSYFQTEAKGLMILVRKIIL